MDKNKDNHINEGKVIAPKVPMPEPQKSGKENKWEYEQFRQ